MSRLQGLDRIHRWKGWLPILMAPLWVLSVWACRYSVRDTGFVDLGLESYRLRWVSEPGGAEVSPGLRSRAVAVLRESNLVWDEEPSGEGFPRTPGLYLREIGGRVLTLALTNRPDEAAMVRAIEAVAVSPLRERVYREGLRAYALVMLFEGSDASANARVRQDAEAAIAATARLLSTMPKPVETPPQLISVSQKEQSLERVLVWGLGLDPDPTESPRVALVYGRGRRLGAPLEGPLITQTALRDRLLLIGQDCECDLDRAWLRGPLLPGRWGRELQQAALGALGFDPGNPMVRAEISRIVERGPQNPGRRRPPSSGTSLGYSEESVEATPDPEPESPSPVEVPSAATVPTTVPAAASAAPPSGEARETGRGHGGWWVLAGGFAVLIAAGCALGFRASRR